MQTDKKLLFRIVNLKQYFPAGKKGLFVKANDGITVDIYEGEPLGLVGESGCGKSTLGRSILQVYQQTDGRTMYYGRSIDEIAPLYVKRTISSLERQRKRLRVLEKHRDELRAHYDTLSEKEQYQKHEELTAAEKKANDQLLDMANLIGGLMVLPDLTEVKQLFLQRWQLSRAIRGLRLRREEAELRLADAEYAAQKSGRTGAGQSAKARISQLDERIGAQQKQLEEVEQRIDALRDAHRSDPDFDRYESYRDSGVDLARLNYSEMRRLRRDLQLIFQDPYSSLNSRMSVGQIIGEGMLAHRYFRRNDDRMKEEVLRVMDQCGLAPYFLHRFPHQFSGGQRQRIGIARSLALRPKFVVCDEAVSALDVSIQAQIINLLKDLKAQQNLTYLFITHDLSVVKYISDRIGVMYLGAIVELAPAEQIFHNPKHPYTRALMAAIPTIDEDADREPIILEGDIPSPVNPPKGCKFHTRCKDCMEKCRQVAPEMREIEPGHFVVCHLYDQQ